MKWIVGEQNIILPRPGRAWTNIGSNAGLWTIICFRIFNGNPGRFRITEVGVSGLGAESMSQRIVVFRDTFGPALGGANLFASPLVESEYPNSSQTQITTEVSPLGTDPQTGGINGDGAIQLYYNSCGGSAVFTGFPDYSAMEGRGSLSNADHIFFVHGGDLKPSITSSDVYMSDIPRRIAPFSYYIIFEED